MYITTGGLVLRETLYKESSKILTVLTSGEGKISVMAKGARRRGSKTAAGTQLFTFSEMTLYSGRGGWTLTETRSIEQFQGLRDDIEKLALGAYFAEMLESLSDEDTPNPEMLQLGLNTLYALSNSLRRPELIKAAFEIRAMLISGYAPAADACAVCGSENVSEPYLSLGGLLHCRGCRNPDGQPSVSLGGGALDAVRYILSCEPKKIFSFKISEEGLKNLGEAAEKYALFQLDRRFGTLDYYKSVKL